MGRFGRSWNLVKLCFSVLRDDKALIVFPIISTIAALIVAATFALPGYFLGLWKDVGQNGVGIPFWIFLFCFYFALDVVIIYFNSALVSAALLRLKGQPAGLGDGFRGAGQHAGAIIGFAVISATVGLILQIIRDKAGPLGSIVAGLGGMAWNIATFLAVPVLVAEGVGPVDAVKRSGALLKKTWGENIIGTFGISVIFGIPIMLVAILGIGGGIVLLAIHQTVLGISVIFIAIVVIALLAVLSSTLRGIYSAALYEYAVGGDSGVFDRELLAGAFGPRKRGRTPML
jgi:hypothetical protein